MADFQLLRYDASMKEDWDDFIGVSKNGTFLFRRDYMDYHSDRFHDHSLVFLSKSAIVAVLPASSSGNVFSSHAGLTYGGLVMARSITAVDVIDIFRLIISYLSENRFSSFIYKAVPHIYHQIPAEEDLYALFRYNASLTARGISSAILQRDRLKFRNIRRYGIKKARKNGVYVSKTSDFSDFWDILEANLYDRHGLSPVHSLQEISLLASRFPDEIALYVAKIEEETLAGVVIYKTKTVAHSQYISASPKGRYLGALDFLFDHLIHDVYSDSLFFDFGISTEGDGHFLNESLLYQKEGFGGRAVCYDRYEIKVPLHIEPGAL
ncbi:MAG: GNAT family N-acetyltransferase [Muribaculaceae bacterium]|nr:GNAT family N-acetyltransferase [Muribaculaceae bacterium]